MIAPCGIEVKVGQVWKFDGCFPLCVTSEPRYPEKIMLECQCGEEFGVPLHMFTNKIGGYRLVKDVEEGNA